MASGLEHSANCPGATTCTSYQISVEEAKTLMTRFNAIRSHESSDLGDWRETAAKLFADEFRVHANSYLTLKDRESVTMLLDVGSCGTRLTRNS